MIKKPLFWETFILLIVVGVLNYIAVSRHLYWALNEFDSIVHFFGGAALSSFFLCLYFYSGFFKPTERNLKKFLVIAVFGGMFVSVCWEIFELTLGEASMKKSEYPFDTTLDLIMDFLGILAVCFYGYLKETKNEIRNTKLETNYENSTS